jgi:hypothetical protein
MYTLKNDGLSVSVLDPVADRSRLGSRYCTGCYIWQVTDRTNGEKNKPVDLFTGPEYPNPNPPVFDGQGAPDAFELAVGHENAEVGGEVLVIGVGRVLRSSNISPFHTRNNPTVNQFCDWNVAVEKNSIQMSTSQKFLDCSFKLIRTLSLQARTLRLATNIQCESEAPVHVRWFAHPFFPHTPSFKCCKFSLPVKVPENPGFFLDEEGFVTMNRNFKWGNHFRPLEMEWGRPLEAIQRHPFLEKGIRVSCEFPVALMPIWANQHTVSFEPYFEASVQSRHSEQWSIAYGF